MTSGPQPLKRWEITSTKAARVAAVRRLHERKHRLSDGAFVVEGPTNVAAGLADGYVDSIYFTKAFAESHPDILSLIEAAATGDKIRDLVTVSEDVLAAMSDTQQPQGVLAICGLIAQSLDEIAHEGTWVVLDQANDPGNAGTVIRTAEACGATAVLFTEGSVDPHNGKCVRATAGALFRVPIVTGVTWEQVRNAASGRRIIATSGSGDCELGSAAATEVLLHPVIWLFGTEAHGLPPLVLAQADVRIRIPMSGEVESLNLASAAAMCLWESCRSAADPQS